MFHYTRYYKDWKIDMYREDGVTTYTAKLFDYDGYTVIDLIQGKQTLEEIVEEIHRRCGQ